MDRHEQLREQYQSAPLHIVMASVLLYEKNPMFSNQAFGVILNVLDEKTDQYLQELEEQYGSFENTWRVYRRMRMPELHAEIRRLRAEGSLDEQAMAMRLIAERVARIRGYPYQP